MKAIMALIGVLYRLNGALLAFGRAVGVFAIALMVVAILIQIVFRYVLNNALPWPDEAARFCMLWMTGLMAPTALRRGGFVAIDTLILALPSMIANLLTLVLLFIGLLVLVVALYIGWGEVTGFGGRFATASLYLPTSLTFDSWFRIPRSWMMASLVVGLALLILVSIELILHRIASLAGHEDDLPPIAHELAQGAS